MRYLSIRCGIMSWNLDDNISCHSQMVAVNPCNSQAILANVALCTTPGITYECKGILILHISRHLALFSLPLLMMHQSYRHA